MASNESNEVIDLVSSSEDESSLTWKMTAQGNKRSRRDVKTPGPLAKNHRRESSSNLDVDIDPANEESQTTQTRETIEVSTGISEADTFVHQPAAMAFINADDGSDDAVVTEGLLALLDKLSLLQLATCSGRKEDETPTRSRINLSSVLFHIQQTDKWSCGFRNLQMLLSALLPHVADDHSYFTVVPQSLKRTATSDLIMTPLPSLRQLQAFLEQSWMDGFDKKGAEHYNRRIVGRKSEIGAVEVSSCLAYLDIDSAVVQFIKCRESRSLLGKFCSAYFSKMNSSASCCFCSRAQNRVQASLSTSSRASRLLRIAELGDDKNEESLPKRSCSCPTLPLYLQWEGHSVTIVGVEKQKATTIPNSSSITLLVFDPMINGSKLRTCLERAHLEGPNGRLPPSMRLPSSKLLEKDCQILMCSIRSLTSPEKQASRERVNAVTAAKAAVVRSLQR